MMFGLKAEILWLWSYLPKACSLSIFLQNKCIVCVLLERWSTNSLEVRNKWQHSNNNTVLLDRAYFYQMLLLGHCVI